MLNMGDLRSHFAGQELDTIYMGEVVDNKDPNKQGRLRVMVPELYQGLPKESLPWAQPNMAFGGGKDYGIFFVPTIGSKVYISFYKDHPWYPIWTGVHWFKGEIPKEAKKGYPGNYVIKTPSGHVIELSDAGPYIRIADPNGNFITLNTKDNTLNISTAMDIRLTAGGNVDITSQSGIAIQSLGNFDVMALGDINLRAAGAVNIDSTVNIGSGLAMPKPPKQAKDV